jgi:pectin methylesterase-like acyl-CoA thioesterase
MLKNVVVNINVLSVRGECTCISLVRIEGYQDMLWVRAGSIQPHLQSQILDLNGLNGDNVKGFHW